MGLHYEEHGNRGAPLLLFIHGGGVSSWMWDQQVQYFTKYYCVTVDLPEQGKSTKNGIFSIEDSAYRILELVNKLAKDRHVTVIGFSLGAQVLIQMLSEGDNSINKAMINSALVRPIPFNEWLIPPLIWGAYPLVKNRAFSKLQAKSLFISEPYFDTYYNESSRMRRETLVRIMKENMSFKLPAKFSEATADILVTVGEKEKSMMKKSALEIVNANDNCTGVIFSGVGHGAPLSASTLFNQQLDQWINDKNLIEKTLKV